MKTHNSVLKIFNLSLVLLLTQIACSQQGPSASRSRSASQQSADDSDQSHTNNSQPDVNDEQSDVDYEDAIQVHAEIFAQYIYGVTDFFNGKTGVAVYLGQFAGKGLFMTSRQIASEQVSECLRFTLFLNTEEGRSRSGCDGGILSLEQHDLSFFLAEPGRKKSVATPLLRFARELPEVGGPLQVLTFDHPMATVRYQGGEMCRLLGNVPTVKRDPEPQFAAPASISVPTGCSGTFGDAGAVVMNHQAEIVGILWTGDPNRPEPESAADGSSIWQGASYMVPIQSALQELKERLADDSNRDPEQAQIIEVLKEMLLVKQGQ